MFVTDLLSDRFDAADADDAEFLTQARAHGAGRGLSLPLSHACDSDASQLKASMTQHGIVLDCHVIPRPDAPADVAARAAAARAALHDLVSAVDGALPPPLARLVASAWRL